MYTTQQLIADTFTTWTDSTSHTPRRTADDYRTIERTRQRRPRRRR